MSAGGWAIELLGKGRLVRSILGGLTPQGGRLGCEGQSVHQLQCQEVATAFCLQIFPGWA